MNSRIFVIATCLVMASPVIADTLYSSLIVSESMIPEDCPTYHKNGWLALHRKGKTLELSPVSVDDSSCSKSGVVDIKPPIKDVIAYINTINIKDKNIKSGVVDEYPLRSLSPNNIIHSDMKADNQKFNFIFSGKKYLIEIARIETTIFVDGKKVQYSDGTCITCDIDEDASESIIWIGDLNHDGYIDIIRSGDDSKSASTCLYLSTISNKNIKLNQVACQTFSG